MAAAEFEYSCNPFKACAKCHFISASGDFMPCLVSRPRRHCSIQQSVMNRLPGAFKNMAAAGFRLPARFIEFSMHENRSLSLLKTNRPSVYTLAVAVQFQHFQPRRHSSIQQSVNDRLLGAYKKRSVPRV